VPMVIESEGDPAARRMPVSIRVGRQFTSHLLRMKDS